MSGSIEIVVPESSLQDVKGMLGTLPRQVRVVSSPSARADVERIIFASVNSLAKSFSSLEALVGHEAARSHARWPLVLLPFRAGAGKSIISSVGAGKTMGFLDVCQKLALLSTKARTAPYVAPDAAAVRRLILAKASGAPELLIASASMDDGVLTVWSCEPRAYRCPVSEIPALAALDEEDLLDFEVSSSGSRIHWPSADIDLSVDAVRARVDPQARREQERLFRAEAVQYGRAIKELRLRKGLRQSGVEGLSEREVRRIEKGEVLPHSPTLKKLAAAHGMSVDEYMKELAELS